MELMSIVLQFACLHLLIPGCQGVLILKTNELSTYSSSDEGADEPFYVNLTCRFMYADYTTSEYLTVTWTDVTNSSNSIDVANIVQNGSVSARGEYVNASITRLSKAETDGSIRLEIPDKTAKFKIFNCEVSALSDTPSIYSRPVFAYNTGCKGVIILERNELSAYSSSAKGADEPFYVNLTCRFVYADDETAPYLTVTWTDITNSSNIIEVANIVQNGSITARGQYVNASITRLSTEKTDGSIRLEIPDKTARFKIFNCEVKALCGIPLISSMPVFAYNTGCKGVIILEKIELSAYSSSAKGADEPFYVNLTCRFVYADDETAPYLTVTWTDITNSSNIIEVANIVQNGSITARGQYVNASITRLSTEETDGSIRLEIPDKTARFKIFNCEVKALCGIPLISSKPVFVYNTDAANDAANAGRNKTSKVPFFPAVYIGVALLSVICLVLLN